MEAQIKEKQVSRSSCQPCEAPLLHRLYMGIETVLAFSFDLTVFKNVCSAALAVLVSAEVVSTYGDVEYYSKNEYAELRAMIMVCCPMNCVHLVLFASLSTMIKRSERYLPRNLKTKELNANKDEAKCDGASERRAFELKLDSVIRHYAWRKLLEHSSHLERYCLEMDRKDLTCIVDWTALTFKHKVTKFSPKVKDGTVIKTSQGDLQTGEKWVTLWSSCYDNLSKIKQSPSFRGSQGTTSWVDVDLERCYTINKEVDVHFDLHQASYIFNAENSVSLNKVKGQVFQETLAWEIDTQVEVEPSSRAHAQLLARQECSVVEFEIRTTLSIPKGVVPVTFKHKDRDVSFVLNIEDLHEAFQLVEEGGVLGHEEKACVELIEEKWLDKDGVEHSTYHPQIITRGTCVCVSWTDQTVDIKTSPLSMDESTSDGDHNMINTPAGRTEEDPGVNSFVVVG